MSVVFDVGGTIFKTLVSTITLGPAKNTLFPSLVECKRSDSEPIFIDRDALCFRFILNYLRNPENFVPPTSINILKQLKLEADYYLLPKSFTETLQYTSSPIALVPDAKLVIDTNEYWKAAPSPFEPGLLEYFSLKQERWQRNQSYMEWIFDNHELQAEFASVRMVTQEKKRVKVGIRFTYSNKSQENYTIELPKCDRGCANTAWGQAQGLNSTLLLRKIQLFWHSLNKVFLQDLEVYGKGRQLRIPSGDQ